MFNNKRDLPESKYDEDGRPKGSKFMGVIRDVKHSLREENSPSFKEREREVESDFEEDDTLEEFSSELKEDFDEIKEDFDKNKLPQIKEQIDLTQKEGKLLVLAIFGFIIPFIGFFIGSYLVITLINKGRKRTSLENGLFYIGLASVIIHGFTTIPMIYSFF